MEALTVHAESLLSRDASKRKRVNRNAKIKQYKLDARREQWLSQGKQTISASGTSMVAMQKELMLPEHQQQMGGDNSDAESCVINQDEPPVDGMWCISNAVSKFISCSHHARGGKPDLVQPPAPAKSKARNGRRRSKKLAPEEEIHGGGGDEDWEAAADALDCQMNLSDGESAGKGDEFDHHQSDGVAGKSKPMSIQVPARPPSLAWTPNDASRPASLPKVVMFRSPAAEAERKRGNSAAESGPLCCLICTEELDCTESSFIPCSCGFRLCLFCHHRISAEDGRCPGCRTLYRA